VCDVTFVFTIDDGKCYSMGEGTEGQLGVGKVVQLSYMPQLMEMQSHGSEVKQIALGASHTLILLESGRVLACGANKSGQLGIGM
jgi:alpha-tubulin suppressor-like RCC1 family protein